MEHAEAGALTLTSSTTAWTSPRWTVPGIPSCCRDCPSPSSTTKLTTGLAAVGVDVTITGRTPSTRLMPGATDPLRARLAPAMALDRIGEDVESFAEEVCGDDQGW